MPNYQLLLLVVINSSQKSWIIIKEKDKHEDQVSGEAVVKGPRRLEAGGEERGVRQGRQLRAGLQHGGLVHQMYARTAGRPGQLLREC